MTSRKRAWIVGGMALAGLLASAARPAVTLPALRIAQAPDSLPAWLEAVVDGRLDRAHWGVAVYDLGAGRWVTLYNADRWFLPASNLKLVVTATALERLGPDYAFRTSLYGTGEIDEGDLEGKLVLYGRGDPNLSGRHAPGMRSIFESLADSLVSRGLRAGRRKAGLAVERETGGSLRRRYLGTVAVDRVRAKTSFIENGYALSSYLSTTTGREYAFSVIVNVTGAGIEEEAQEAIDRLVLELVEGRAP